MIIYHGSTDIVEVPRIIVAEVGRDFGSGFYTTDIKEQAIKWALRVARIRGKSGIKLPPVLNIYELDEKAFDELNVKHFDGYTMEWLDMVVSCRSDAKFIHGFDIMTGKIADDDVGETVQTVVDGLAPKDFALNKLKYISANNQICFNTNDALSYLRFTGHEQC